jgi:hypothetical protein
MEKKDVPQDRGILGHWNVICYATDENGDYVRSTSAGWEPTNIANGIAWEYINEELAEIKVKVRNGELSPLAYHLRKFLMDARLLSHYTGISAWKVRRHLKPGPFNRLDEHALERYAAAFNLTVEQLKEMPE